MLQLRKNNLFHLNHGIIPACDVNTIDEFREIVARTSSIEGIVGYKIGCVLSLKYGLTKIAEEKENYTDLPIIYDHQKAGTDIPQMGEQFAMVCKQGRIKGVIIFPQAGPNTEREFIKSILDHGLIPLVGGEMTHPGYLQKEEGFIRNGAPEEMYKIGAEEGADYFIVPGNRVNEIKKYRELLSGIIDVPKFCMPGIGRQGGDISDAFEAVEDYPAYAIIGSGIYKQKNIEEAAKNYCKEALKFE